MTKRFRCSYIRHKKDRGAKFPLFRSMESKHLVKCLREKKAFVIKIKEKGKEKKEWRRSKERTNK